MTTGRIWPAGLLLALLLFLPGCMTAGAADSQLTKIDPHSMLLQLEQHDQQIRDLNTKLDTQDQRLNDLSQQIGDNYNTLVAKISEKHSVGIPTSTETGPPAPCIKIDGVDTDTERYLSEWLTPAVREVKFEGTREDLVSHLAAHQITDVGDTNFRTLEQIHAARVEQEIDQGNRPDHQAVGVNPLLEQQAPEPSLADKSPELAQAVARGSEVTKSVQRSVSKPVVTGTAVTTNRTVTRSTAVAAPAVATHWVQYRVGARGRRVCRNGQCR